MTVARLGRFVPLLLLLIPGGPPNPSEIDLVETHIVGAEMVLAGRDLTGLSARQRANRTVVLRLLSEYRQARSFPVNEDFPGERVPYFRDRHGTLCAMAYLLDRTGRGDIVEHVAATRNNARVVDLADEPGLAEWLDEYGLTLAEAARVQPAYGGVPGTIEVDHRITTGYAVASGVGLGTSLAATILTLGSPKTERRAALVGVGAGLVTATLGAVRFSDRGEVRQLAVADMIGGGIAALVGIQRLAGGGDAPARTAVRTGPVKVAFGVVPGRGPTLGATIRF